MEKTTGVPSSYSATIDINYPVTINSDGSHSHSGPSHSHSGPNHQHTIGYYSTTTGSGGDPSHAHSHYIRSGGNKLGELDQLVLVELEVQVVPEVIRIHLLQLVYT